MYRGKKIIGIIPARNGSKGITHKNMVLLNNHPLIWWTIKSAKESSLLDEIVVSTDGAEIAEFAHNEGVSVIHRPAELASDTSPTIECIIHALQHYKSAGEGGKCFDYMMLLQPTSPLRRPSHIDDMIRWMIDNNYENAVSVSSIPYNPILMRYKRGDALANVLNRLSTVRRQDMNSAYYVNGYLYLWKTEKLSLNTSLNDARHGYEIDNYFALDINTPEDLKSCEILLSLSDKKG